MIKYIRNYLTAFMGMTMMVGVIVLGIYLAASFIIWNFISVPGFIIRIAILIWFVLSVWFGLDYAEDNV